MSYFFHGVSCFTMTDPPGFRSVDDFEWSHLSRSILLSASRASAGDSGEECGAKIPRERILGRSGGEPEETQEKLGIRGKPSGRTRWGRTAELNDHHAEDV